MSKVKQGQSFLDKVTQFTGSCEKALEMALLNNKSITDALEIGEVIIPGTVTNKTVVAFFNTTNQPATAATINELLDVEDLGIGKMAIKSTFIVN